MVLRRFEWLVWGLLAVVMVAVVARFAVTPPASPLPVLGNINPFRLTNQLGNEIRAESLRDEVVVFNTIFSRCPGLCHTLSQQMSRVQKELPEHVRLISLTTDSEYDTPKVLVGYGERYGCDARRWMFLTGPRNELYRLATNDLKFTVLETSDPANPFIHSDHFAIVDAAGRLRAIVHGEETGAERKILELVRRLVRER